MSRNVPDDWDQYYHNCSLCGQRYHASDGGCDCIQEECQCGECRFMRDESGVFCDSCNTGPWVETKTISTEHTARKDHKSGSVKAGEKYIRTVTFGYYPNGKSTRYTYCYPKKAPLFK